MVLRSLLLTAFAFSATLFAMELKAEDSKKGETLKPITVTMKTSISEDPIVLELDPAKAPKTVENFVKYAEEGFYNGTIFHRVISSFMIQGGGFTPEMKQKATKGSIQNEASNGLKNERGTIAMARTSAPHSATAQFFINTKANPSLDYRDEQNYGYAVFGKVTKGMDVVDKIEAVRTHTHRSDFGPMGDVPVTPVVIETVTISK